MKRVTLSARLGPARWYPGPLVVVTRANTLRGAMGKFAFKSREALEERRRALRLKLRLSEIYGKFGASLGEGTVMYADTDSASLRELYSRLKATISDRPLLRDGDAFETSFIAPKLYVVTNRGAFPRAMTPHFDRLRG